MTRPDKTPRRFLEPAALILILLAAGYFRLTNLADNPGWYTDEATHLDIAHHLLHGRVQYMAVGRSVLLFARPPLFHLALAGLSGLFGEGIATLRGFTALLGLLSVGLVYAITRRMAGSGPFALLCALLLAVYPQAVLYSRFGFSYNLLVPLLLVGLFGLWAYWEQQRRGGLALAALALGVGGVGDLMIFTVVPAVILVALARDWRDLVWSLPLLALPFGIYAALMLLTVPDAFWFDLSFTLSRLGALSLPQQVSNVAQNYTILLSQDFWMLAGAIGMFLLKPARLRHLVLLFFWIPLIVMGRTVALYSLSFYYMIPLLPSVAVGVAALVWYGTPYVWQSAGGTLRVLTERWPVNGRLRGAVVGVGASLALVLVILSPFLTAVTLMVDHVQNGFPTTIAPFLISPDDARRVADYVSQETVEDDLVIASPPVAWQFEAQTADYQMSIAFEGEDTPHMPGNTPHDRYVFDPRYTGARFVVVDNLWRNWGAVIIPGALRMLHEVEDSWTLVFEAGSIQVYRRPNRTDPGGS